MLPVRVLSSRCCYDQCDSNLLPHESNNKRDVYEAIPDALGYYPEHPPLQVPFMFPCSMHKDGIGRKKQGRRKVTEMTVKRSILSPIVIGKRNPMEDGYASPVLVLLKYRFPSLSLLFVLHHFLLDCLASTYVLPSIDNIVTYSDNAPPTKVVALG